MGLYGEQEMAEITTEELRSKATSLGIKFTATTADDILLNKIEAYEKAHKAGISTTKAKDSLKVLKRVQIAPLNPNELHLESKFFMLSNTYATLKKVVLFNTPIFLEQVMIEHIKGLEYLQLSSNADKKEKSPTPAKAIRPAYTVTMLSDITPEELKAMKEDKKTKNMTIKD